MLMLEPSALPCHRGGRAIEQGSGRGCLGIWTGWWECGLRLCGFVCVCMGELSLSLLHDLRRVLILLSSPVVSRGGSGAVNHNNNIFAFFELLWVYVTLFYLSTLVRFGWQLSCGVDVSF